MKQILQNLGSGETLLAEVPWPTRPDGNVLIRTRVSMISIGTEKMLIEFGKAGWIEKARNQPDKVRQVLDKIRTDGLLSTVSAVRSKLDQPIALGYANVGEVIEAPPTGPFEPGERVVSNGPHAEIVSVPKNLCTKVPPGVSDSEAAFTVVTAIGLQGIRLVQPTLGESVVVTGLGLIGLLCVQLLRAHGCRVLGIDYDSAKCAIARQFGAETVDLSKAEDPLHAATAFSSTRGVDAVLITAATQSNEPVHQAALMCRKRGRIVLVGNVGLNLSRADFYEKELSFQVSCSYGPGRYDSEYEQRGHDYPIGFVRWTEQRNFEAVLEMFASKRMDVAPLLSHRFKFDDALEAYKAAGSGAAVGILLDYEAGEAAPPPPAGHRRTVSLGQSPDGQHSPVVAGIIGAGGFAGQVLLPALKSTAARIKLISSASGVTGTHFGRKFGIEESTTDTDTLLTDPEVNAVFISTRPNTHARFVLAALRAKKPVFVEKPLCIRQDELDQIVATYHGVQRDNGGSPPFLMVGFNRRFAPQITKLKQLLDRIAEPKTAVFTVNAGIIPPSHWMQDPEINGPRFVSEGCHYVDLLLHLIGAPITTVQSSQIRANSAMAVFDDKVTVTLRFADGSIGTVHYFANGHKSFAKERLEVFCAGRVVRLDNFKRMVGFGWPGFSSMNLWRQDKGHRQEIAAVVRAMASHDVAPIPFEELRNVAQTCLDAIRTDSSNPEQTGLQTSDSDSALSPTC